MNDPTLDALKELTAFANAKRWTYRKCIYGSSVVTILVMFVVAYFFEPQMKAMANTLDNLPLMPGECNVSYVVFHTLIAFEVAVRLFTRGDIKNKIQQNKYDPELAKALNRAFC
ncbi:MAG: hypothetical protein CMP20_10420 [Rickettsiales bacterium]|nr:hypothetical protein [Rickettsiales bacterium]